MFHPIVGEIALSLWTSLHPQVKHELSLGKVGFSQGDPIPPLHDFTHLDSNSKIMNPTYNLLTRKLRLLIDTPTKLVTNPSPAIPLSVMSHHPFSTNLVP